MDWKELGWSRGEEGRGDRVLQVEDQCMNIIYIRGMVNMVMRWCVRISHQIIMDLMIGGGLVSNEK